jgi:predicted metal-dependent peptidase
MPPVPWDVELAKWFDMWFAPLEKHRTYARPSRRQSSTPDIPRPCWIKQELPDNSRTYGVIIDTSGSMSPELIGKALGAAASYSVAKDVPYVRVVFCDAQAYDIGYVAPEDIAGRVVVKGRGGTVLQPAVDLLENAKDFPKDGPILIITDAGIESDLKVHHEHALLIPQGKRLPFRAKGKVFYYI